MATRITLDEGTGRATIHERGGREIKGTYTEIGNQLHITVEGDDRTYEIREQISDNEVRATQFSKKGMLIGYTRVSTTDQDTSLQIDALEDIGCDRIFTDQASGVKVDRPELARALDILRAGDTLAVYRLDRLGRSLKHLVEVVEGLQERDVALRTIVEGFDTTTANGKLVFHVFAAMAEFERELIRERTLAGLQSARARGRLGGRPKTMDERKVATAKKLYEAGTLVMDICKTLGISKATFYRTVPTNGDRSTPESLQHTSG